VAKLTSSPRYQYLCHLLVETRKEKHLLQTDVALKLKKPRSFISKYETGIRRLDPIELMDITKALEIDYCSILKQVEKHFEGIER